MRIVALIMAGGKGTRFGKGIEKPMVKLLGKSLIRRVIEATKASKKISEIYVAVTVHNPHTAEEATKASAKVIVTEGQGYHADLRQAILTLNLTCPVLTISSDLPLLTGEFLDEIIVRFEESRKPSLTVLVPVEQYQKYGLHPTTLEKRKGNHAVSGINIVDGKLILEEQPQEDLQEEIIICRTPEAMFNVNTPEDLESTEKYLLRSEKSQVIEGS